MSTATLLVTPIDVINSTKSLVRPIGSLIAEAKAIYSKEVGVSKNSLLWCTSAGTELQDDEIIREGFSVCSVTLSPEPFYNLPALKETLKDGERLTRYTIWMLWRHCSDVPTDDDCGCLFKIPRSILDQDCKREKALLRRKQAYFKGLFDFAIDIDLGYDDYNEYRFYDKKDFAGYYDTSTGYSTCFCQHCNARLWFDQDYGKGMVRIQDDALHRLDTRYKRQGRTVPFVVQTIPLLLRKLTPDTRFEYTRAELREWIVTHGIADQLPLSACGFRLKGDLGNYIWEAPPNNQPETLEYRLQHEHIKLAIQTQDGQIRTVVVEKHGPIALAKSVAKSPYYQELFHIDGYDQAVRNIDGHGYKSYQQVWHIDGYDHELCGHVHTAGDGALLRNDTVIHCTIDRARTPFSTLDGLVCMNERVAHFAEEKRDGYADDESIEKCGIDAKHVLSLLWAHCRNAQPCRNDSAPTFFGTRGYDENGYLWCCCAQCNGCAQEIANAAEEFRNDHLDLEDTEEEHFASFYDLCNDPTTPVHALYTQDELRQWVIDNEGIRPLTCPPDHLAEHYEGDTRNVPEYERCGMEWVVTFSLRQKTSAM